MGSGASTKVDLSSIENLQREFETHGDDAIRLAWELTAKQLSSNSDLEIHLCQLRRLASTLTKDPWSTENKERRYFLFFFPEIGRSRETFQHFFFRTHRKWLEEEMNRIANKIKVESNRSRVRSNFTSQDKSALARSLSKITSIDEADEYTASKVPSSSHSPSKYDYSDDDEEEDDKSSSK